jgi:hypothetical protein
MKHKLLLLVALFSAYFANAQKGKFLIQGSLTFPNYSENALKALDYKIKSSGVSSQLTVGYFFSDKLTANISVNTGSASSEAKDVYESGVYQYSYTFDVDVFSFLAGLDYNYVASDKRNLSSGHAVGSGMASVKSTVTPSSFKAPEIQIGGFAYHIKLIEGRYYFTDKLGVNASLGLGWQGLLGIGLTSRF